jgi:hypothetical protein
MITGIIMESEYEIIFKTDQVYIYKAKADNFIQLFNEWLKNDNPFFYGSPRIIKVNGSKSPVSIKYWNDVLKGKR